MSEDAKPPRSPADIQRDARFRERRSVATRMRQTAGVSAKAIRFAEFMVFDGADWQDAARAAGITRKEARAMLASPFFGRELAKRTEELRNALNAANPRALAAIRDRGLAEDASAADARNSIQAIAALERREDRPNVTFNGPVISVVGMSIDLSGEAAPPRQIAQRSPFIDRRDAVDLEGLGQEKSGEDPER